MLYVARDKDGQIQEIHSEPRVGAHEALPADNPEVLQFIHDRERLRKLEALDREFIRVIEDTLELLMAKNLILFTDLPPTVREKLLRRRQVRQQTSYMDAFGRDDDVIPL